MFSGDYLKLCKRFCKQNITEVVEFCKNHHKNSFKIEIPSRKKTHFMS